LATLPVTTGARIAGAATRTALGAERDEAYQRAMRKSADALVSRLAKARGPAMKFGQVLALMSQALPEDQAALLAGMSRLYEDAQPQPWGKVEHLFDGLPDGVVVERDAVAAASLGQVHRAVWTDGRPVAVKVQYPDAPRTVKSDMAQLRAMVPLIQRMVPGLDVRSLLDEHAARLVEELDYRREAAWLRNFRFGWAGEPITVPDVVYATSTVLVTEWLDGMPWTAVKDASQGDRDRAGTLMTRFVLLSAVKVGAVHADPHPGNYRLLPDGTLGVLDFGAVATGAGSFTRLFLESIRCAAGGDDAAIHAMWDAAGLLAPGVDEARLAQVLKIEPGLWTGETFRMDMEWVSRYAPQTPADQAAAMQAAGVFRFPPEYLLEHRAMIGGLTLVAMIGADVPFASITHEALAGLTADDVGLPIAG
jgi:predicted unusual protein kinase regulating ubiquinone biosynthesis (AarF/ABC1/UbiB family)